MSQPITSVVKVATTAAQAKIFAALLQAEGIPAQVDGDSLADEVAISRRLIHLNGTRVMVPTASLARAREILAAVQIPDDELEAQAMAAEAPEQPVARPAPTTASGSRWPLLLTGIAAITFLALWLGEVDARAEGTSPLVRFEPIEGGIREIRRRDDTVLRDCFDRNRNGNYERLVVYVDGKPRNEGIDEDEDGRWETSIEHFADGSTAKWTDADHDGQLDSCTVQDAKGKIVQRLGWQPGAGYVTR